MKLPASGGSSSVLASPAAQHETPGARSSPRASAEATDKEVHQQMQEEMSYAGNDAAISPGINPVYFYV